MSESAEKFLIEQRIVQKPTTRLREVLGCIACRWNSDDPPNSDPKVYGYQILKCRGIKSGVLYPILQAITDGGVIEPHNVIVEKPAQGSLGTSIRKTYHPVDTELGAAFRATLEPPADCHLDERDLALANLPEVQVD